VKTEHLCSGINHLTWEQMTGTVVNIIYNAIVIFTDYQLYLPVL